MGLLDLFSKIADALTPGTPKTVDEQVPQNTTSQQLLAQQAQPPTGQSMLQAQLPGQPMQGQVTAQPMQGGVDQAASPTALMTLQQLQQPPSLGSVMGRDNPYAAMMPEPKPPSKLDTILSGLSTAMKVAGGVQAIRGGADPLDTIQAMGAIAEGLHDFTTEAYLRTQAHQQQVNERIKSLLEMANQERAIKMQGLQAQGNLFTTALQGGHATQAYGEYITQLFNLPENSFRTNLLPQGLTEELMKRKPSAGMEQLALRMEVDPKELMKDAYLVPEGQQELNLSFLSILVNEAKHMDEAEAREAIVRFQDAKGQTITPELLDAMAPVIMGVAGAEMREIKAREGPPGAREKALESVSLAIEEAVGLSDKYKMDFPTAFSTTLANNPKYMSAWLDYESSFIVDPNQVRQIVEDMAVGTGIFPDPSGGTGLPMSSEAMKAYMEKIQGKKPEEVAQITADTFKDILGRVPDVVNLHAALTESFAESFKLRLANELKRGKLGNRLMAEVDKRLEASGLEFSNENLDLMFKTIIRDFPELAGAVQDSDFYKEQPQESQAPRYGPVSPLNRIRDLSRSAASDATRGIGGRRADSTPQPREEKRAEIKATVAPASLRETRVILEQAFKARILRADSTIAESIAQLRAEMKRQKPDEIKTTTAPASLRETRVIAEQALEELVAAVRSGAVKGDSLLSEWYAKQPSPSRPGLQPMQFPQGR